MSVLVFWFTCVYSCDGIATHVPVSACGHTAKKKMCIIGAKITAQHMKQREPQILTSVVTTCAACRDRHIALYSVLGSYSAILGTPQHREKKHKTHRGLAVQICGATLLPQSRQSVLTSRPDCTFF
jgi:hypothetical protein